MFGKKFLQSSSGVVLSTSLVSMVQSAGVFADNTTEVDSKVSSKGNFEFLSGEAQSNNVAENAFDQASLLKKAEELKISEAEFLKYKTNLLKEAEELKISEAEFLKNEAKLLKEAEELGVNATKLLKEAEEYKVDAAKLLKEAKESEVNAAKLLKENSPEGKLEKLQDLENRKKEVSSKLNELKEFYKKEMKRLKLEDRELTKEANKIKFEMFMQRVLPELEVVALLWSALFLLTFTVRVLIPCINILAEKTSQKMNSNKLGSSEFNSAGSLGESFQ